MKMVKSKTICEVPLKGKFSGVGLEETMQMLFQAVEQSSNVIIITDHQGDIEYVNPKFSHVTGYQPEEVIGKNPRLLKSGELSDQVYKELWQTVLGGDSWSGEFHNRTKSGEMYWALASISPVKMRMAKSSA